MKNRNKWITIAFLVFIFSISFVSVVRMAVVNFSKEGQQEQQLTEEEKEVLIQNGTMKEEDAAQESPAESVESVQPEESVRKTWFARLKDSINNFTNGLFGRTKLIAFNTELTSLLTGGTYIESTQVLKGKNNMFFYKTEIDGHPLWDYMGINRFSDEELAAITENLVATKEHLEEKGIEFYAMCVPNKEIVYAENMPDTIARVNDVSRGEQLAAYVNENAEDLVFVYPKEELLANKEKAQLYFNTDSHSNQIGAFVNMQALFQEAYGTHAKLNPEDFIETVTDYSGDLVTMAGLAGQYYDSQYLFDIEKADPAQYHDQVLLFVGDSFGGFLSVVCKGYYKKVYWEHPDIDFKYSMYEEYQPDVVIWENAERYCEKFMEPLLRTE